MAVALTIPAVEYTMARRHTPPITCVQMSENYVALTFEPKNSDEIDRITQALGAAKATFFVTPTFLSKNAEQIVRLEQNGHEIGILEKGLKKSKDDIYSILAGDIEFAAHVLKRNCSLIRFHNNRYDNDTVSAVFSVGLYPIQWSADSYCEQFSCGDIILVEADADISNLLKKITADGLETASVSELLIKGSYTVDISGQMQCVK